MSEASSGQGGSAPREYAVSVNGHDCRVWEAGDGEPLGYLAGLCGLPRWTPVLDRLAERRRVVVPSLPGFPGATGHDRLDDPLDWITATLDLLDGVGLAGADLVGVSVGATLAAEAAAMGGDVRRLVLCAPFGLFDAGEPPADPFARRPGSRPALCADPERLEALLARPESADEVEWQIQTARAEEAAARLLWPLGDTRLARRLHRVRCPTLVLWGGADAILPASYAKRFADAIAGPVEVESVEGAGHLVDLDAPGAVAERALRFLEAAG